VLQLDCGVRQVNDQVANIRLAFLTPHPLNPRIEPRQEIVDQLAVQMANGCDPSHALIVRVIDGGYQIISGHHRWLAAQKAGLPEVPCWVRDLSDADAYMQLVLCNTQSELHALEEGKHAVGVSSERGGMAGYAKEVAKSKQYISLVANAYDVYHWSTRVDFAAIRDQWRQMAEIHAAPEWLWSALVARMVDGAWTVAVTREHVAAVKSAGDPPPWADAEAIAKSLALGTLRAGEIVRFTAAVEDAKVRDEEPDFLRTGMLQDLTSAKPGRLSDVQTIVAGYEKLQADIDAAARATQIAAQRAAEDAEQRIATLRASCPLSQWQDLNAAERAILLAPGNSRGGTFNQQEGVAIEWAQWSWNPVTGCKHACPYCYAREIALSQRMAKVYTNGWEPSLCSNRLGAPGRTKVPEGSEKDTRYRNVFTCSMADLFGRWVPGEWIEAVLSSVRSAPQWNFLFLTKFPQRLAEIDIPDNAWMGTTVDVQARVANAEKAFAKVGGKVKWLSVEPMIEPLRFERLDLFDWVVIGGASPTESDGESPQTPEWKPPYRWIDSLVRQCDDAKVPVYMKSNLGIANRVLQLPFDAPIKTDPQVAPEPFKYLGK